MSDDPTAWESTPRARKPTNEQTPAPPPLRVGWFVPQKPPNNNGTQEEGPDQ